MFGCEHKGPLQMTVKSCSQDFWDPEGGSVRADRERLLAKQWDWP